MNDRELHALFTAASLSGLIAPHTSSACDKEIVHRAMDFADLALGVIGRDTHPKETEQTSNSDAEASLAIGDLISAINQLKALLPVLMELARFVKEYGPLMAQLAPFIKRLVDWLKTIGAMGDSDAGQKFSS